MSKYEARCIYENNSIGKYYTVKLYDVSDSQPVLVVTKFTNSRFEYFARRLANKLLRKARRGDYDHKDRNFIVS